MIVGVCGLAGSGKDTTANFLARHGNFTKVAFADPLKRICLDVYKFTDAQLWGPSEMRNAPDMRYPRPHGPFKNDKCLCCGVDCGGENWRSLKDNIASLPPCYLTARFALQQLGSEWGRDCYPPTWVEYAIDVSDRLSRGGYTYDYRRGLSSFSLASNGPGGEKEIEDAFDRSKRDTVISDVRFKNEVAAIKAKGGKVIRVMRGQGLEGAVGAHRSETEQAEIPVDAFNYVIDNREWSIKQLEAYLIDLVIELKK